MNGLTHRDELTPSPPDSYPCRHCNARFPISPDELDAVLTTDHRFYCPEHEDVAGRNPRDEAFKALAEAERQQCLSADDLIRWPFRSIDLLAGALAPGRVSYVAAFSGNGKTSFLSACRKFWLQSGVKVSYLPLESNPSETMTTIACANVGIDPDYALRYDLLRDASRGDPMAQQLRSLLIAEFRTLEKDKAFINNFRIDPTRSLSPKTFERVVAGVAALQSDILIVDHVDHVEADEDNWQPMIAASDKIQMMALDAAKQLNIHVVLATQLNSRATGGNKLAHYQPPMMDWIYNKSKKEQIAAVCLGLYRPIDETLEREQLAAARSGTVDAWKIAKANRMGVSAMKLRYGGKMKDRSIELAFKSGTLSELTSLEQAVDDGERNHIRTQPFGGY